MWKKIHQYVEQYHMISPGDKILLGISGGADSVLLARYLLTLRQEGKITLYAMHLNHMIRGQEALRDEEFVRQFCETWQIPCRIYQEDVCSYAKEQKRSVEEAGRDLRYLRMKEYANEVGCEKIALAHHEDDLAETVLFRMVRGTGPKGLPGILPVHENKIRPLLCVDKATILGILKKISQDYVEDSSNQSLEYTRNYIRHHILTGLRSLNEQAVFHIRSLSEQMQEQNEYVDKQMETLYRRHIFQKEEGCEMSVSWLQDQDPFVGKEMIRRMLLEVSGQRRDITSVHIHMVWNLVRQKRKSGSSNHLPYHMIAVLKEDALVIEKQKSQTVPQRKEEKHDISKEVLDKDLVYSLDLGERGRYFFEILSGNQWENEKKDCVECFDYDKIKGGLSVRTREEGDFFVMNSRGQRKSLRRYFIDAKVPAILRDQVLLLAEGNHILWITGYRISEAYKVTEQTQHILCVRYAGVSKVE